MQARAQLRTGIKPRTWEPSKGADYSQFYSAKTLSQFSRSWCNFLPFFCVFFFVFFCFLNKKWKCRRTHFLKGCFTSSWLASDLVSVSQTESKQWNSSILWSCYRMCCSANSGWPVPAAIIIHSWALKLCLCSCLTCGIHHELPSDCWLRCTCTRLLIHTT